MIQRGDKSYNPITIIRRAVDDGLDLRSNTDFILEPLQDGLESTAHFAGKALTFPFKAAFVIGAAIAECIPRSVKFAAYGWGIAGTLAQVPGWLGVASIAGVATSAAFYPLAALGAIAGFALIKAGPQEIKYDRYGNRVEKKPALTSRVAKCALASARSLGKKFNRSSPRVIKSSAQIANNTTPNLSLRY